MTGAIGFGLIGSLGALVLVGSAILTYRRQGRPVARYALIWAAIFVGTFIVVLSIDHNTPFR